ncbi:adenylyltransferase/cytidyltransferase family protein [Stutzerimonas kunmingensis]|uniref:adenylyltransferase/cytidyltransferase family protein n=1 Tax=Stutzerimonas kunmingensis TaxID=1211807 RepID=UPI0028A1B884|nr:adenylyltransferase/cytidyltransferase family protein [Stutzerimonas kunmingensis]
MKTVITYGTFDMFHVGHLRLFRRMRELGERIIVAVSTDEFNALKGKKALVPYEERREIVEAIGFVDLVIPENSWEQKADDIRQYGVDCFVMGSDWFGHFDYLAELCEVVYLERTQSISSTHLRRLLGRLLANESEISKVLGVLRALQGGLE